ncbi:group IIE secretory phospholipase A2-like isoform X1 [Strix aluco]|uniref:group IIE secretory phospholipase A2-like isoform X1 n=1 Tax=Strix aluco TaxID=111821 RepID=UPI003DA2007F
MGRIVNICPLRVLQRRGPAKRAHGGYKRCDQQHLGFIQTPELPPPDMKLFLLLLCLTGLTLSSCNLLQFSSMIKRKTGKSALSYNGYGCYCGLRGSKQPLDATDWCCHAHDCCYKRLASSSCSPKWVKYNYSTRGNQIVCGKRRRGVKDPSGKAQPSALSGDPSSEMSFRPSWLGNHLLGKGMEMRGKRQE